MRTIRCRNKFKDKKNGRCGHILFIVTDLIVDLLKIDPEGGPIMRCPGCPRDQRWMRVVDRGNGIKFEVVEPPKNMPPEPEYEDEEICIQVG